MKDQTKKPGSRIAYIGEMAGEFAVMARRENRQTLAYLLEMVLLETQSPGEKSTNERSG